MYRKKIGEVGEQEAIKYLVRNRYKILIRNFRCRFGEIDIIARDGEYIVFIEVKTRKDCRFGVPSEAVSYHKRHKIIKVAQYYLLQKRLEDINVRFDIVEVIGSLVGDKPVIESVGVIKDAFQL